MLTQTKRTQPAGLRHGRAWLAFMVLAMFLAVSGNCRAHAGRVERLKLTAPDAAQSLAFGRSVDLIGDTAIVGSFSRAGPAGGSGTAYLFDIATGNQLLELQPSGAGSAEKFGQTVAISGDWAVVGAPHDDEEGTKTGAAYVFDVASGQQVRKLTATDAEEGDRLGFSVAMDGDLAIIGAWDDDDHGDRSGAAYLFNVRTREELFKLTASDAMADDRFSFAVAISEGRAIVGTSRSDVTQAGTAYIFDIGTGDELFKLSGPSSLRDGFGESVAIDGNLAAVGALGDDDVAVNAGATYLFDAMTGLQLHKLRAMDAVAGANFARSAIEGDRIIVGAPDPPGSFGAAYLFDTRNATELLEFRASDRAGGDIFGSALAISGNRVVIGAAGADEGSGAVYVFFIPEPPSGVLLLLGTAAVVTYLAARQRQQAKY